VQKWAGSNRSSLVLGKLLALGSFLCRHKQQPSIVSKLFPEDFFNSTKKLASPPTTTEHSRQRAQLYSVFSDIEGNQEKETFLAPLKLHNSVGKMPRN